MPKNLMYQVMLNDETAFLHIESIGTPMRERLINQYISASQDDILTLNLEDDMNFVYVPKKKIMYITTRNGYGG